MEEYKAGMQGGAAWNVDLTLKYIKPALNKLGFEIEFLRGDPKERYDMKEWRKWSTFQKRFFPHGSGLLSRMWYATQSDHFGIVQCLPTMSLDSRRVQNKPRLSIPADVVTKTTEANRIATVLELLDEMEVYFLIYICISGTFAFGKFSDIPIEHWGLTYRHNKERLDRLYLLPEYQKKLFLPHRDLEKELRKYLKV
jgi:hypothetical protein